VNKEGGSARTVEEITAVVQAGEEEVGGRGQCATRAMSFTRPSASAPCSKKGALPGISSFYHFGYEFDTQGVFTGLRVWMHEGIGPGKLYPAEQCNGMWEEDGLCKDTSFELKQAGSTLPQSHPARIRAEGSGARVIRGEVHRVADDEAAKSKQQRKLDGIAARESSAALQRSAACAAAKVRICPHCMRAFVLEHQFSSHVQVCIDTLKRKADLRKNIPLRPASEIAKDPVHSAASLGIGEGVDLGGIDNKELYFPHKWIWIPPSVAIVVPQGWARKCVGRTHTRFTSNQIEFLKSMFDAHRNGSHKVREGEAQEEMQKKFSGKSPSDPWSRALVLSVAQIKSWFSQEAQRRRIQAARSVIARGITEVTAAQDVAQIAVNVDVVGVEMREEIEGGEEEGGAQTQCHLSARGVHQEMGHQEFEESEPGKELGLDLMHGALYVVVREEWVHDEGFEVWEFEENVGEEEVLPDEIMISHQNARKWVHDSTLVQKGQGREDPVDLPDKPKGGGKLGKKGERRFAPRRGRRWAKFEEIEPAQYGDVWVRIHVENLEMYKGRVSFVFNTQVSRVKTAYEILNHRNSEEEEGEEEGFGMTVVEG